MNEQELRELLKLIRGIEHFIERCLRTEKEKNEERLKKQLENSGINITEEECTCPKDGEVHFVDDMKYCPIHDSVEVPSEEFPL